MDETLRPRTLAERRDLLAPRYRTLVTAVQRAGTAYPKDHGNWVCLRLTPDVFVSLDTWNRSLVLLRGDGTYRNRAEGFAGSVVERIGIDFGYFEAYVSGARIEALLRAVERASSSS